MENLRSHKHTTALFELYENELKVLSRDHNNLQLKNAEIRLHYSNKLRDERKEKRALSQELDQLKKKLLRVNSMDADNVTSVKKVSTCKMEAPGQNLEGKHSVECLKLATELEMEKKHREVLSQQILELNQQLQMERDLRAKAEAKASETVEIADELVQKLDELQNVSNEASVTTQALHNELKIKVEGLHQEITDLNQLLQKEKELKAQAEADKHEAVKIAEALCKEMEDMQSVVKSSKKFSDIALQKLNTLEKRIENMANQCMAERKERDCLQQEMEERLQRERDLRDQTETNSLRDFEALEALCQELTELKSVSEDQFTQRQTLSTRLNMEEKKQKGLCHDILWLVQMLEKEMELRAQAETDKLEAIKIGEALCQKIERYKVCSWSKESEKGPRPRQRGM
ncbi:protein hook homolog [Thunnus thynnus]|uniref:protein hook homolog n=1 Tax=Thunnus thynnus TaxID=8237 RepID=UPI003526C6A7